MSSSYGEKKYKEPDDLNATFIVHRNWDNASHAISYYLTRPNNGAARRSAVNAFRVFYAQTIGELKKRGCEVEKKMMGVALMRDIAFMGQLELFETFTKYEQELFDYGILSFQKMKDSDEGGYGGRD